MVGAIFVWAIAWTFTVGMIAEKRGRDAILWGALGLLFSFFALLVLFAMDDLTVQKVREGDLRQKLKEESHKRRLVELELKKAEIANTVDCPRCAETIKAAAKVCRFCGYEMTQEAVATVEPTTAAEESQPS